VSRAFVKDDNDGPEPTIARSLGDNPNYVTATGLEMLREALADARFRNDARNVAYYERRVASAILDDSTSHERDVVAFGSIVTTTDASGKQMRLQIVGEDEADPARGSISWISPYAQALLDRRVGEKVTIHRPAGAAVVTIASVE
jgi:transcription elongation GreA/GreB family factor